MEHFEKIIGYDEIKQELEIYLDMMKCLDKYAKLGVRLPRGIMFEGFPGLGKTLMAESFIKASGWRCYTCRKHNKEGVFLTELTDVFRTAAEHEPAIVFLDDMDKFSNEDKSKCDTDTYVTIQTEMDNVREKNILVVATVNDRFKLPQSLIRAGRIEKCLEFKIPDAETTKNIVKYYLSKKSTVEDMDVCEIAGLLGGGTCADLEEVLNDAASHAAFQNKEKITMDDIIKACLRKKHIEPEGIIDTENSYVKRVAYHEAAHALVAEKLGQGEVCLVALGRRNGYICGKTSLCEDKWAFHSARMLRNRIKIDLAGRAAIEMVFGGTDMGTKKDYFSAYETAKELVCRYGLYGLGLISPVGRSDLSEQRLHQQEQAVSAELERNYEETKRLLGEYRETLDKVAQKLLQKKILLKKDIEELICGQ